MKIMKTDLLLLDNKIKNEGSENTTGTATTVAFTDEPKEAMNALMFKGLQNLMANPKLANQVGTVIPDEEKPNTTTAKKEQPETVDPAKSYATNINFKGGKIKTLMAAAAIAMAGMIAGSCESGEKVIIYPGDDITNVEVNISNDAMVSVLTMLQTTLNQMLLQQQMSYDQFQKYMDQMEKWIAQLENRLTSVENILLSMATDIIDIKNGVQENNGYQQLVISLLEQQMTRDEAKAYLETLIKEVQEGKKDIATAMAEVIAQLQLTNQNLATIISQLNDAAAQREEQLEILKNIDANTEATKEQVEAANERLTEINTSIINSSKMIKDAIDKLDKDMKCSASYIAQTLGWSTYQVISYMQKLGIDLTNNATANKDEIVAAIERQIAATEKGNEELAALRADYAAGRLSAEEFAQKMLDVMDRIDTNVATIISQLNDAAKQREEQLEILKNIDKNTAETKEQVEAANEKLADINTSIINSSKMIKNAIDKLDKDMKCSASYLAQTLGWSTYQVISYMQKLGIDLTNNATANKDEIVAAIERQIAATEKGNEELAALRADYAAGRLSAEEFAQKMLDVMDRIDSNVSDIKDTLSQFVADWADARDSLFAEVENIKNIAKGIYKEERYQSSELRRLNKGVQDLKQSVDKDRQYLKAIYEKIQNNSGSISTGELQAVIKKLGCSINAGLDEIVSLIKIEIEKEDEQSKKLASIDCKLSSLGCISSVIVGQLANIDKDLDGLDEISKQLDTLIKEVQNLSKSFNIYAKRAADAQRQELDILKDIKANISCLGSKLQTLIYQNKKAEVQRNNIEAAIKSLQKQVEELEGKLGHTITPDELDEILSKHDAENQEFYAELINNIEYQPGDCSDVKELLNKINQALVEYQGQANALLADILAAINAMDKTAPDYNAKLDKIIKLMEGFKFECNCSGDCNNNNNIHEGILDLLK